MCSLLSLSPFSLTNHVLLHAKIHDGAEGGKRITANNAKKELRVAAVRASTAVAQRKVAVELDRLFEVGTNRTRWRYEYPHWKMLTGRC